MPNNEKLLACPDCGAAVPASLKALHQKREELINALLEQGANSSAAETVVIDPEAWPFN